jgi:hypothetical protein
MKMLEDDMRRGALSLEVAKDRGLWWRIHDAKRPTWVNLDMLLVFFNYGGAVKLTCGVCCFSRLK